jgi:hypothetical protein
MSKGVELVLVSRQEIIECPFIKDNVSQGFIEHFHHFNLEHARVGNHGHFELGGLYHEKVKIPYKLKEQIWRENKV